MGIAVKHKSNTTEHRIIFHNDIQFGVTHWFVKIVTAPKSKSQLEMIIFGQMEENEEIVSLSKQLTRTAVSRGHKLVVQPVCSTELSGLYSLVMEQYSKAGRMPDSLLYGNK